MRASLSTSAFTLVELIVAMAVLSLMIASLAVMINGTIGATILGSKHLSADTEARMALDRIVYDFSKMVKRPDVDYYFQKNPSPGSDQMAFYSESGGYFTGVSSPTTQGSTTSLVGYRINSNLEMERLSKGLVWNGVAPPTGSSAMVFLPDLLTTTWPLVAGSGTDPDYQVIGDQIFRLELCYLVHDSLTDACLSDTPYLPTSATALPPAQADPLIAKDLMAVVVTVAVLDSRSRLQAGTRLQGAANLLTHVTGTTMSGASTGSIITLPAALWTAQVNSQSLGLPTAVNNQVRIYQRYIYVNGAQ
jgi:prepilin-type N-terminal cleavage/methylation domain-containing protein